MVRSSSFCWRNKVMSRFSNRVFVSTIMLPSRLRNTVRDARVEDLAHRAVGPKLVGDVDVALGVVGVGDPILQRKLILDDVPGTRQSGLLLICAIRNLYVRAILPQS